MIGRVLGWMALAGLVGMLAFALLWRIEGGRWSRVETPSMGTVAPVGSLLWIKPVPFASLRVGDFITFHPPGRTDMTYSHRIARSYADGTVGTKGVIPAADPWRIGPGEVVGKVVMRWRGVGWLVAAVPLLFVGGCAVMAVRMLVTRRWRTPVTVVLASLVLACVIVWWRPFVGADQIAVAPEPGGGATATYVGTGVMPVRITAPDGGQLVLTAGEVGRMRVARMEPDRAYRFRLGPAISWWWWGALVSACFVPALWRLVAPARWDRRALGPLPATHRRGLESHRVESHHRSVGATR